MTPYQIELVQTSFRKVAAISETAAELFYQRLFEIDPRLRSMFRSDMREQGKKLMDMLRLVVSNLATIERVVPIIGGLARRHEAYGVKDEHYRTVGQALIDTLEKGLGKDFTADVCDAWLEAYSLLSRTMMGATANAR